MQKRLIKLNIYTSLLPSVSPYICETWTLKSDLEVRTDAFRNKSIRLMITYRWLSFVINKQLFRDTESKPITRIVIEHQPRLYAYGVLAASRYSLLVALQRQLMVKVSRVSTELMVLAGRRICWNVCRMGERQAGRLIGRISFCLQYKVGKALFFLVYNLND